MAWTFSSREPRGRVWARARGPPENISAPKQTRAPTTPNGQEASVDVNLTQTGCPTDASACQCARLLRCRQISQRSSSARPPPP
eukprot:1128691-Pyramimonas_sp.AAC.1